MAKGLIGHLRTVYRSAGENYGKEWREILWDEADACGSYRACFLYPRSNIVFKVPLSVRGDICCESEFRIYEEAEKAGLEMFFAKPLKRVEICDNVYAYTYEYVGGAQPIECYLPDYIEKRLHHRKNKGRKQIYERLVTFLEWHNIRDLHDENWVLTPYRLPKILDYGWF